MKLLIIKTSSLGDILQAFLTLSYLRGRFPHAQIDWVVEKRFSELVKSVASIDRVICIDSHQWRQNWYKKAVWKEIKKFNDQLRQTQYDVVFDLQANCKSGLIQWRSRSKNKVGFGWRTVHEKPNWLFANKHYNPSSGYNICEDYLYLAKSYFQDEGLVKKTDIHLRATSQEVENIKKILETPELKRQPRILICPGSAWPNKQLTLKTLRELLERLDFSLNPSFLIIWGNPAEKETAVELHSRFPTNSQVIERLSLAALQELMRHVELIISMDSLPLHLAGLTNTPTFSIFGASLAQKFKPPGKTQHAFQGECPYGRRFEKRCPILRTCPTGACVRDLQADKLFKDFSTWWKSQKSE